MHFNFNSFTPKSDQCQISPAASPEILHHTVRRTWLFIAHSDERWLYNRLSLHHLYILFNPFTPESDQCQISPPAPPEILHHTVRRTWLFIAHSDERWLYNRLSLHHLYILFNPFTPESDQCQISPPAPPEILHHTVRRTWLFIAYSDERWLYNRLSLHHLYILFNPFTPESDQCQISPPAPPEILHHTVRRTWLFIAYSDERWLYNRLSLHHLYILFNPFTPESDQCQISPPAPPEILHHTVRRTWLFIAHSDERWLYNRLSLHHLYILFNPFTPESDQCQISPPAPPEILHHTVRRTWLFIAYSDERWLYNRLSLHHLYILFNPFTPESDQCQISPPAPPEI